MRNTVASFLIVAAFPVLATASPLSKICGQPSGESLRSMEQSVAAATEMGSGGLAGGLSTLQHFPAVQALIKRGDVKRVCASGVVLNRNIYKNNLDLLVIEIERNSGEKLVLPTLLQTASIQAYEGPGGRRPWIGFPRQALAEAVRNSIAQSTLQEVALAANEVDPVEVARPLLQIQNAELDTRGYAHIPDVDPEWTTYIVTQLRFLGNSTSYASHVLLDTVVVQVNGSRVRLGNLNGFFAAYHDLMVRQNISQPKDQTPASQLEKLESLAR